jgi:hypothetical protein
MKVGYVVTTSFQGEGEEKFSKRSVDDVLLLVAQCVNSGDLEQATELLKQLNDEIKKDGGNVCKHCGAIEGHADPEVHGKNWQRDICWKCY